MFDILLNFIGLPLMVMCLYVAAISQFFQGLLAIAQAEDQQVNGGGSATPGRQRPFLTAEQGCIGCAYVGLGFVFVGYLAEGIFLINRSVPVRALTYVGIALFVVGIFFNLMVVPAYLGRTGKRP